MAVGTEWLARCSTAPPARWRLSPDSCLMPMTANCFAVRSTAMAVGNGNLLVHRNSRDGKGDDGADAAVPHRGTAS